MEVAGYMLVQLNTEPTFSGIAMLQSWLETHQLIIWTFLIRTHVGLPRTYGPAFFSLGPGHNSCSLTWRLFGHGHKPPQDLLCAPLDHTPAALNSGLLRHALGPKGTGEAASQIYIPADPLPVTVCSVWFGDLRGMLYEFQVLLIS